MYFHTTDPKMAQYIANVATLAAEQEQTLRIDTDDRGYLRIKRGEGGWSPPFRSTADPYRDQS